MLEHTENMKMRTEKSECLILVLGSDFAPVVSNSCHHILLTLLICIPKNPYLSYKVSMNIENHLTLAI